jgi:D-sedoheptulose 7-phosphate isomerase
MDDLKKVKEALLASIKLKDVIAHDDAILIKICHLADLVCDSLCSGGKVIFAGNGGSFADAQHLSAEFTSKFLLDRAPISSIVLGANSSSISAIGNDFGYDQVFARELGGIAKSMDVFIPISTSGNSKNIIEAAKVSSSLNIKTIGFTGFSGGELKNYCSCIQIPSSDVARIQECHITIGHILCQLVEESFFNRAL